MRLYCFAFVVILLAGCCPEDEVCNDPKNPDCPNFNPCLVFEPADAAFIIQHTVFGPDCMDGRGQLDIISDIDTTISNTDLSFIATHIADSYEWRIGNDPRVWRTKEFTLYFPNSVAPANIDVTLIVCKTPPTTCQFQICDTLIRTFYIFNSDGTDSTASILIGDFKGATTDNSLDSFIITIPPPLPSLVGIVNFPNGCQGQFLEVNLGRKAFVLYPAPTVCQSACGIGQILDDRRTLVIDYSVFDGEKRVLKKFVGRKLN